jgi:hypothetical protein
MEILMCARYAWFVVMILVWISVHILFLLFTADSKYIKLTTHSNFKPPNVKFWRNLCREHFHVLGFPFTDS